MIFSAIIIILWFSEINKPNLTNSVANTSKTLKKINIALNRTVRIFESVEYYRNIQNFFLFLEFINLLYFLRKAFIDILDRPSIVLTYLFS